MRLENGPCQALAIAVKNTVTNERYTHLAGRLNLKAP